ECQQSHHVEREQPLVVGELHGPDMGRPDHDGVDGVGSPPLPEALSKGLVIWKTLDEAWLVIQRKDDKLVTAGGRSRLHGAFCRVGGRGVGGWSYDTKGMGA